MVAEARKAALEEKQVRRNRRINDLRNAVRDFTHCPECKAPQGEPCVTPAGNDRLANHQTRLDLWRFREI